MGIQTTQYITREYAAERIMEIASIVLTKDYRVMEYSTNEHDEDLESFVDRGLDFTLSSISKWTDRMLEDKMDEPFYRYSIFENYLVGVVD